MSHLQPEQSMPFGRRFITFGRRSPPSSRIANKCPKQSQKSQKVLLPMLSYKTRWYNTVHPTVYLTPSILILLSILSSCTIWDKVVQHGTSTMYQASSMLISLSIPYSWTE